MNRINNRLDRFHAFEDFDSVIGSNHFGHLAGKRPIHFNALGLQHLPQGVLLGLGELLAKPVLDRVGHVGEV